MIELDPHSTALVLIDLQKGILGNTLTPVTSQELLARGRALAERFRAARATVVLVNVAFSADGGDMLRQRVDEAPAIPKGGFPAGWNEFPPGLMQPGDLLITKRQWARSTAPSWTCSCVDVASAPSCWAASPPRLAWNPPRARLTSTATSC